MNDHLPLLTYLIPFEMVMSSLQAHHQVLYTAYLLTYSLHSLLYTPQDYLAYCMHAVTSLPN
jgi:hypothetical protein